MPFLRRVLQAARDVLHLEDPPRRIALALAVGVFISCTPFWGLQTLLSVAVATVFRLNRAATVAGAWLNLPWTAPFVYAAALKVGDLLVPDRSGVRSAWLAMLVEQPTRFGLGEVLALLREVSLPLLAGTTAVGGLAALATYLVAVRLIGRRRPRDAGDPRRRAA